MFVYQYNFLGPAFTVIYVIAGLPLARLADTRSRSLVLLIGIVFWSAMVFLTGFVKTFWQLLVLRIFLGIGEVLTVIKYMFKILNWVNEAKPVSIQIEIPCMHVCFCLFSSSGSFV